MMQKINAVVDTIRRAFISNNMPGGGVMYGIKDNPGSETSILSIYPNPAGQQVTIRYRMNFPGDFSMEIRDLRGVLKNSPGAIPSNKGDHEATLSTANLQPGIYLLKIICGQQTMTRKLVISH
jgi:hypothetical protein